MGQLKQEDLSDVRRSELVSELSVTLVDRALYASPEEREDYWRRAWEITNQFADSYPDHPRLLLVQTQGVLAQVTRGELGRQEAEVLPDGERRREEARNLLRDALRTLNELAEQVADALRERSMPGRQRSETPGELTVYQLATLQKQIQFQTARALRNQALCYPDDSPDRANALGQAIELLDGLAKLGPKEPLSWPSRIDEIVCLRLLKDYEGAARNLEAAKALEPNPEMSARLAAERIRLALASGDLGSAVREANQVRVARRHPNSTSLDWKRHWPRCKRRKRESKPTWRNSGRRLPWRWPIESPRATAPTGVAAPNGCSPVHSRRPPGTGSLDRWAQAAENDYLSGQFDEALATYDEAATMARQQNDTTRAFHYAFLAATIERERGKHAEALRRYRELATAHAANVKAAEAHQLAIQQAAEIAQSGEPGTFDAFVDLLREHLQYWPKSATANSVRWQLARIDQSQGRWADAIAAYQQITPDFDRFEEVIQAVRRCYQNRLERSPGGG